MRPEICQNARDHRGHGRPEAIYQSYFDAAQGWDGKDPVRRWSLKTGHEMKTQDLFDVAVCSVLIRRCQGPCRAFAEAMLDNGARVTLLDCDGETSRSDRRRTARPRHRNPWRCRRRYGSRRDNEGRRPDGRSPGRLDVVFANAGIDAGPGFLSMSGERDPQVREAYLTACWEQGDRYQPDLDVHRPSRRQCGR